MSKFKILFPIETTARELVYKLVLSTRLANMGYECYLGSKNEIQRLFEQVHPFVYFDKGYHSNVSEKIYNEIKKNNGIIVNLDEEGGVDFKDSSTISARYPDKVFKECDLIFLWGLNQYHLLKDSKRNISAEKVIISGHPRFDLLKKPNLVLYEKGKDILIKKFGNYILINTNMGFGNNIRGDSFVRENYGNRIKNIDTIINFDKKKIELYISFIEKLSPLFSGKIILRPHPEENHTVYNNVFNDLKNVKVIFEGPVIPWILGAEVMIHPDCTTGVESLMLGKKSISYLPKTNNENIYTYLPVKLSHQCNNEDDLLNIILEKKYPSIEKDFDPLLNENFSFEKDSTSIIVERVHKLLSTKKFTYIKELPILYSPKGYIKDVIRPYYHKLLKKEIKLSQNKLKGFDHKSVENIFNELSFLHKDNEKATIQLINSSLYRIIGTIK